MYHRKIAVTIGLALILITAGCTTTATTPSEFENQSSTVQTVETNESAVALTLTDNFEYTTQTCSWNPATKTNTCTTYYHDTNSTKLIIKQDEEIITTRNGNFENETVTIPSEENGTYSVTIELAETNDTINIGFNRTATGNTTEYYENTA